MSDRGERLLDRDGWPLLYRTAYTRTIGARLRRMREAQRLTQNEARHRVERPRGGPYSQSMLSRLEAGYANAPLYVYIHFAEAYDVDAGTPCSARRRPRSPPAEPR